MMPRTIRLGDMGPEVKRWQWVLGINESGVFDGLTDRLTRRWQSAKGLDADGIVGPKTWGAVGLAVGGLTSDIDSRFFPKLILLAAGLGADPADMLAVMYSESQCRATAWNDNPKTVPPDQRWNASGLIQFMPATLAALGWKAGHEAFRRIGATEQLRWVDAYYRPYKGRLGSVAALYVATFLPALIDHAGDSEFVLTAKAASLAWAYLPNAAFDAKFDLRITVGELDAAVCKNCRGGRWAELRGRLREAVADPTPVG